MEYFIWMIACVLVSGILYIWIIPFIKIKFGLWIVARKLKKMSKKYPEMKDMADKAYKIYENTKIDDI